MRGAVVANNLVSVTITVLVMTCGDGGSVDTLLAFLTTTCASCQPFWESLAEGRPGRELGIRLAIVLPSPSMEDERVARRLTPPGAYLHMGSETWFDYGVGQATTFVLVRSPAGGAPPWEQTGAVLGSATPADPAALDALVRDWLARAAHEPKD